MNTSIFTLSSNRVHDRRVASALSKPRFRWAAFGGIRLKPAEYGAILLAGGRIRAAHAQPEALYRVAIQTRERSASAAIQRGQAVRLGGSRAGDTHPDIAAIEVEIIQARAGVFRAGGVGHRDEAEALGTTGMFLGHDERVTHGARDGKEFMKVGGRDFERQISDVELGIGHGFLVSYRAHYLWLTPVIGLNRH